MKVYNQRNHRTCRTGDTRTDRIVAQVLAAVRANGGLTTSRSPRDASCGTQVRPPAMDCKTACTDLLLSCETTNAQNSANRTAYYAPAIGGLAVNGTTPAAPFAAVPAIGALDFLNLSGRSRTVYLTDLTSTLTNLDDMLIIVAVGGVVRFSLNAGRFARANANGSTTACGLYVCAGALETVSITVFNQSAAAFGAGDSARVETRTMFPGEPGYMCSPCSPAPCSDGCGGDENGVNVDVDVEVG